MINCLIVDKCQSEKVVRARRGSLPLYEEFIEVEPILERWEDREATSP